MNPILLRYVGFALAAVIAGAGGGYLAVNTGTIPAIPAQPIPGQGIPAEPAIPATPGLQSAGQGITVLTPNGGETFFSLENSDTNLITWRGNTRRGVKIALLREKVAPNTDPTPFIIGWIFAGTIGENIYPWNDRMIFDETFNRAQDIPPGKYKILVASDDGKGNFTLWNKSNNKPATRFDISDNSFTVAPRLKLKVLSPNGGETFKIGEIVPIRFEATGVPYNPWFDVMSLILLKSTDNYYSLVDPLVLAHITVKPGDGTYVYEWDTSGKTYYSPQVYVPGDYYIIVDDARNGRGGLPDYDRSDATFSILAP